MAAGTKTEIIYGVKYTYLLTKQEKLQPGNQEWLDGLLASLSNEIRDTLELDDEGHWHGCGDDGAVWYEPGNGYILSQYGRRCMLTELNLCLPNG